MKTIFLALILTMFGTLNAYALNGDSLREKVICKEGYKFLIVYSTSKNSSPAVIQIFKKGANGGSSQPVECGT